MRKHLPLIVGFGMPVLLIIAVILSIYIPRFYTKPPQHSFLFMSRASYPYVSLPDAPKDLSKPSAELYEYVVDGDRLVVRKSQGFSGRGFEAQNLPSVYLYDVKANTYTTVPKEEVSKYKLVNSETSPDGYEITSGSGGDSGVFGLFFGGGRSYDYNSFYLTKNSSSEKLNLPSNVYLNSGSCYGSISDCGFAGWVVE